MLVTGPAAAGRLFAGFPGRPSDDHDPLSLVVPVRFPGRIVVVSVFSITDANRVGISGLVSSAESGQVVTLSRHGKPVAEIVSREAMDLLRRDRETLRDVVFIMTRMVTDSGNRTELDDAMEAFGINRDELESEIKSGLHTLP